MKLMDFGYSEDFHINIRKHKEEEWWIAIKPESMTLFGYKDIVGQGKTKEEAVLTLLYQMGFDFTQFGLEISKE